MPVEFTDLWPNKFGFDFDFMPDKCHIFPSFKIKNSSLSPIYVMAEIVSGRYKFTDGSTVKELGSVDSASSRVFTMELVASPLNTHTSETVTIKVSIFKYKTYTGLIGEFQFNVEVFYIDKGRCKEFDEVLVTKSDLDNWFLESGNVSNIADFDGSGYCIYIKATAPPLRVVEKSIIVRRDVYGTGKNFVGCAIGYRITDNGYARLRFYLGDEKLMDYNLGKNYMNKWYYVIFNIPNVGNTTVKIELFTHVADCSDCDLFMDDLRYYEL